MCHDENFFDYCALLRLQIFKDSLKLFDEWKKNMQLKNLIEKNSKKIFLFQNNHPHCHDHAEKIADVNG